VGIADCQLSERLRAQSPGVCYVCVVVVVVVVVVVGFYWLWLLPYSQVYFG
jgi:hypothetical protein